jgi:hypothetical protein
VVENNANFTQFRTQLYHEHFNKRADTLLELVDALSSDSQARSVVELSLNPCFRRDYSSLFKAIADYAPEEAKINLAQLAAPCLPQRRERLFWLLGVDVTPYSRPFAYTLSERECVYQSSPVSRNKPITFGHSYSSVFALPERVGNSPHWVIPLDTKRVNRINKEDTGAIQVRDLLEDKLLPFHNGLCVEVTDCGYSKPAYLAANRDKKNLITITRARSNRVFYHPPDKTEPHSRRGHVRWFGSKFDLRDPETWGTPEETLTITLSGHRGKVYRVKIEAWYNILMRGKRKKARLMMQNYPFTLVKVTQYNGEGKPVFISPMWLIVMGEERQKLSLLEIYEAYRQRYDVEHFFRFGKQKMLLSHYQTPETNHEENWWKLAHLAYLQLWVAKEYAVNCPRPWECYLPSNKGNNPSPAMVQRSMERIIREFGKISKIPKPRGYSPGRQKGMRQRLREHKPIIRSGQRLV